LVLNCFSPWLIFAMVDSKTGRYYALHKAGTSACMVPPISHVLLFRVTACVIIHVLVSLVARVTLHSQHCVGLMQGLMCEIAPSAYVRRDLCVGTALVGAALPECNSAAVSHCQDHLIGGCV
jgi:hypothetical protein